MVIKSLIRLTTITLVSAITSLLFGFIMAIPIMWLWNFVVPAVFELNMITYWQAYALYMLITVLFNGEGLTVEEAEY